MMKASSALAALLSLTAGSALAQDTPTAQLPAQVTALAGCWQGTGEVMGKPVTLTLSAKPVVLDAMFLIETDSRAKADPADRYAAHLLIGTRKAKAGFPPTLSSFWADSFGGDYAAAGAGAVREDGFEIAYPYPPASFVNRWTLAGDRLEWRITAREGDKDKPFAHYEATRVACPSTGKHG